MLGTKEKKILEYLYEHREDFSTSKALATYLSYTDRTIRTYMKRLSEELSEEDSGFTIESKQGFGYRMCITDEEQYLDFIAKNNLVGATDYCDIDNRHRAILNILVFEERTILFDDLAEQLFVSRSTLSSDFKKIRQQLDKYHLSIESKPYRGVYVQGTEQDKRHFIMDYFFNGNFNQNITYFIGSDMLDLPISLEELMIIVLDECRNHDVRLSDYALQNLVIHLGLALRRFKNGFRMETLPLDYIKYQKELDVAKQIIMRLEKRLTSVDLIPSEEVNYIALHLISKSNPSDSSVAELKLRQEVMASLAIMEKHTGYEFTSDIPLLEGLLNHLAVLIERLNSNIHLGNPLLNDIKDGYLDILEMTRDFVSRLETFKGKNISDDELAYVTLHFMASVERLKEQQKLNVLVICATGYGSAQMLKNRIINELGNYVSISDVIGYYDLDNSKLEDVDVIMSTIDLSSLVFNVPVLTVSVFLSDSEIEEAKHQFSKLQYRHRQTKQVEVQTDIEHYFDQYFSKNHFIIVENATKEYLLSQMVQKLSEEELIQPDEFRQLLNSRESLSTFVFDEDIAVPHPLKPVSKHHLISVAIVKNGLSWEPGYEKVRLIFLVSPSKHTNEGLQDITSRIVDLVDLPETKEALVGAEDFESFKSIFINRK